MKFLSEKQAKPLTSRTKFNFSLAAIILCMILLFVAEINQNQLGLMVSVLQKGLILAIAAVSMNLLTGFTGLFSLGQAGFMAIGAYTTAILTMPMESVDSVYYVSGMAPWLRSIKEVLNILPAPLLIIFSLILGGLLAAVLAGLVGIPILRLKSDYLAIATLGLSEIIRALIASPGMDRITNGSYGLKSVPGFEIRRSWLPAGTGSLTIPFIIMGICVAFVVLLIRSSYGRAFQAIREDDIAAEAMGINLFKHKEMSFVISSFLTAISGGLLAMFMRSIDSSTFRVTLTYDILLIVVIGGLGSITGSVLSAIFVTMAKEWWLRFFDQPLFIGDFQVPLFRTGFRMLVFSLLLLVIVLFYRRGLMGRSEFSWAGLIAWPGRFAKRVQKGRLKRPEPETEDEPNADDRRV